MTSDKPSLFMARTDTDTGANKTGTWRYVRPVFRNKTAPCSVGKQGAGCPAGEDIAKIQMLMAKGDVKKAYETIRMENPMPSICGRVCHHPCEAVCNRKIWDEAVSIRSVERYLGDSAEMHPTDAFTPLSTNGKTIAVIGAGPAGLSAAFFLSRLGYGVYLYEAENQPGGVLRWGIPEYRLPVAVLEREINGIVNGNIQTFYGNPIDENRLSTIGATYDGVFLGAGYGRSVALNIPGASSVISGLSLLKTVKKNGPEKAMEAFGINAGDTVTIIGGGNTAVDTARTLYRMGTFPVIVYRRRKCDMPAFKEEVEALENEDIPVHELLTPVAYYASEGHLVLRNMMMEESAVGASQRVIPTDGTEMFRTDKVVTSIGAEPEPHFFPGFYQEGPLTFSNCLMRVDKTPLIYGGDLVNRTQSVADAVLSGKQAAIAFDAYFTKGPDHVGSEMDRCRLGDGNAVSFEIYMNGGRAQREKRIVLPEHINTAYFEKSTRFLPENNDNKKIGFSEDVSTISRETAEKEAYRCFNCGLCNDCDNCGMFCPDVSISRECGERSFVYEYCKGCGICAEECPRNIVDLVEESENGC